MFPRLVLLSETNDLTSCLCKLGAIAFEDKERHTTSRPTADVIDPAMLTFDQGFWNP